MNRRSFLAKLVGCVAAAALPFTAKAKLDYKYAGTVTGRWTSQQSNHDIMSGNRFGKTVTQTAYIEANLADADIWVATNLR